MIDSFKQALRGLAVQRGTALFAICILACGLGLSIAMYCVLDAVLLRQLPYPNAERIVQVQELAGDGDAINLAGPNVLDLTQSVDRFAATTWYGGGDVMVAVPERVVRVQVTVAGGDFFDVFGLAPARGRTWSAGDGALEAVIGHGLWQSLFAGREDVLGRTLDIDGERRTVVGVMPPGFSFPRETAVWMPADASHVGTSRSAHNWRMLALLDDGDALAVARAQADALAQRLVAQHGDDMTARGFDLTPLAQAMAAPVRRALQVLGVGVAFLLLIAVSNAVNLLLAMRLARARDFALRAALGASMARMLRQCLTENVLVVGLAWLAGLGIAAAVVRVLVVLAGNALPRVNEIAVTPGVVLVSAVLAALIASALTLAALPGVREAAPAMALREGGRGQSAGRATLRTRAGLLVVQTALTTVLLVAAVLLGRSFLALMAVDPGFEETGAVRIQLSQPGSEDRQLQLATARRYQQLADELAGMPGVTAVGGVNSLPLTAGSNGAFWDHTVTDFEQPLPQYIGYAEFRVASAGYFAAAGIPLLEGRDFDGRDRPEGEHVAIVSRQLAKDTWGNENPIGKRIQVGNMDGDARLVTVVGIVGDVRERRLEREAGGAVYVNLAQRPRVAAQFNLVVRSTLPLSSLMPMLRQHLETYAAQVPYSLQPLAEVRVEAMAQRRFNLVLLGVFAGSALLLAGSGLYGLMAFSVGQRRSEFAIRQALGAQAGGIGWMVLRNGLLLAGLGLAVGVAAALSLSHLLRGLLFGVPASDVTSLLLVAGVLGAMALVASLLPAWRASRTEPVALLR